MYHTKLFSIRSGHSIANGIINRTKLAKYSDLFTFLTQNPNRHQYVFSLKHYSHYAVPTMSAQCAQKNSFLHRKYANNGPINSVLLGLRSISTHEISKGLQLLCEHERCVKKDPNTLKLKSSLDKPLVILLPWLMSKPKHIRKYAQIYIEQGFDVITVSVTPWQVMWPKNGTQIIAGDVVKFLSNNVKSNPLILHGFSVGGYVWGECMVHMARDIDRYRPILDLVQGQIWDSAVELTEIKIGLPKAMFPKNDTLQKALSNYMMYHMKTFHEPATSHYIRSSQMFHSTLIKKPALFLLSNNDPIGSVTANLALRQSWESLGIRCDWKCWDKSPHVGHFQKYRDDYVNKLFDFLQSIKMAQGVEEKIRIRI